MAIKKLTTKELGFKTFHNIDDTEINKTYVVVIEYNDIQYITSWDTVTKTSIPLTNRYEPTNRRDGIPIIYVPIKAYVNTIHEFKKEVVTAFITNVTPYIFYSKERGLELTPSLTDYFNSKDLATWEDSILEYAHVNGYYTVLGGEYEYNIDEMFNYLYLNKEEYQEFIACAINKAGISFININNNYNWNNLELVIKELKQGNNMDKIKC